MFDFMGAVNLTEVWSTLLKQGLWKTRGTRQVFVYL
jgi:hypothetical protein